MKYLQLIAAVALLHQYQRDIRPVTCADDKTVPCVVATLDDLAIANRLAHETLGRCLDDMPPQTRRLLALIEREVAARCAAKKMEREDVRFTRRQVREATGWNNTQLHIHLKRLEDLEYVLAHRSDRGHGFVHELVYDGGRRDGRPFMCGLFDVEKLRAGATTTPERSGVAAPDSGSIRPSFGPDSGPIRGEKNAASPSENRAPGASPDGNTLPGDGLANGGNAAAQA